MSTLRNVNATQSGQWDIRDITGNISSEIKNRGISVSQATGSFNISGTIINGVVGQKIRVYEITINCKLSNYVAGMGTDDVEGVGFQFANGTVRHKVTFQGIRTEYDGGWGAINDYIGETRPVVINFGGHYWEGGDGEDFKVVVLGLSPQFNVNYTFDITVSYTLV